MQGNDGLMLRLNSGGSMVKINTEKQKYHDSETGVLCVERCITYSVGKRFLSFKIFKVCKGDRVNEVFIYLTETENSGKDFSFVNLNMRFVRNDCYGVMCSMDNALSGSYEMRKKNYCVPPSPDTEVTLYSCRETGVRRSCLTLEKKKENIAVEGVKVTHSFVVENETLSVKVKITNDIRVGLRVDVEGPVKLKMDYSNHVFGKITQKMETKLDSSAASLFQNNNNRIEINKVKLNNLDLPPHQIIMFPEEKVKVATPSDS